MIWFNFNFHRLENNKLRSEVARLQVNVFTLEEEKEALQIKLETLTSKSLDYDK